ncbi:MAG: tyrosine-type recombinase/integrase, partial [Roseococcus sp.]|nr:tyrosine-type recombinase/integrase [Roseococcus sp.]
MARSTGCVSPLAPPAVRARARRPAAGSVSALIADYRRSRWWAKLAPSTRRDYEWCLALIEEWAGDQPARAITAPAVQALYAAQLRRIEGAGRARRVVETPAKAAAVIRVLRLLLGVGERLGYIPAGSNPAARPGISLRRQREPVLWSPEAVRHMAAVADRMGWRSVATGILLNEWIGQREADLLALPPWSRDAGTLLLRQSKTGRRVALPIHLVPHLVARLEGEASRPDTVRSLSRLLVHDRTGKPWTTDGWRHVFAEIRSEAAREMPDCAALRFAELRHTAVTRLHEAGVDEQGIAGVTGHTPGSVRAILDR